LADPVAERTETAAKSQFLIGETLFLQEKWAEAFLAYQKVFANYDFPEWQAAALIQSGKCDEQQQQWKEAAATYRLLIEKFPNSPHAADAKQRLDVATKKLKG
jgi:TolA-binding protein